MKLIVPVLNWRKRLWPLHSGEDVLIAGDVGPLGVRLAPFGRVQPEHARAAFAEQISVLYSAGVDLIVIETMNDLFEAHEAVHAAKETCTLPVVVSVTFTRDDRTILGDSPEKAARVIGRNRRGRNWRQLFRRTDPDPAHSQSRCDRPRRR